MVRERLLFIGGWGHHYLRDLVAAGSVAVDAAACPDGHDDMARLIPETVPSIRWFDDPAEALDRWSPDVVSVGAVYGRNGFWTERALAAGAHVVSDKPVASSVGQLDRLEELVVLRPDARLVTELPARAQAGFRTARALVADGAIGEPVLATAQKSYPFGDRPAWYDDPDLYPGTELWVATHALDFVRFVADRALTPVAGRSANLTLGHMPTVADHTVTLCEMQGGGTAVIHADYLRPPGVSGHGDDRLRVAGSVGVIEVGNGRCRLLQGGDQIDVTDETQEEEPAAMLWHAVHADGGATRRSLDLAATALAAQQVGRGH